MKMIIKRGDTIENIISVESNNNRDFRSTKIFSIDDAKKVYEDFNPEPVNPVIRTDDPIVERLKTDSIYDSSNNQHTDISAVERIAIEMARRMSSRINVVDTVAASPYPIPEESDMDIDTNDDIQVDDEVPEMVEEESPEIESEEINDQVPGYGNVYVDNDQTPEEEESKNTVDETV